MHFYKNKEYKSPRPEAEATAKQTFFIIIIIIISYERLTCNYLIRNHCIDK